MKIIILKNILRDALVAIEKATVNNLNLPILTHALIKVHENKIRISATNLELAITAHAQGKIMEDGELTVPAAPLLAIINNLNSDRINLESRNNTLEIKTDNYEAVIQGLGVEEFPIIPHIENQEEYIEINSDTLKEALGQVVIASQFSELRPEISGVLFSLEDNALKLVATDSFRLAEKTISSKGFKNTFLQGMRVIVPLKTAQEVMKSIKDNAMVKVFIDENQVLFETEENRIISRLIDGRFPEYEPIIPKSFETEISINRDELMNAIKLTGVLTSQTNDLIMKLNENKKVVELSSFNQKYGKNHYLLPVKSKGASLAITFNWRFLLDTLKVLHGDEVVFGLNSESRPALIKTPNDTSYFYILMPIRNS